MKIEMNENASFAIRILAVALAVSAVAYCTSQMSHDDRSLAEAECYKSGGTWGRLGWSGMFGCVRKQ